MGAKQELNCRDCGKPLRSLRLEVCDACHKARVLSDGIDEGVVEVERLSPTAEGGTHLDLCIMLPSRTPPAFTDFKPHAAEVPLGTGTKEPGELVYFNERPPVASTEALHFSAGKLPVQDISVEALLAVAAVMDWAARSKEAGGKGYGRDNWRKGMKWRELIGSCLRHLLKFARGEDLDEESRLSHIAHFATDALFLLHYIENKHGTDDRVKTR